MILGKIIARFYKIQTALKLRCEKCYFTRREGVLFVGCKTFPRHKQRQGRPNKK
jgi:ribosomal protein L36